MQDPLGRNAAAEIRRCRIIIREARCTLFAARLKRPFVRLLAMVAPARGQRMLDDIDDTIDERRYALCEFYSNLHD